MGSSGRLAVLAMAAAFTLGAAGCSSGSPAAERSRASSVLFHEAGCAGCHSLAAAGARGRIGPDLDSTQHAFEDVARRIRTGGVGMPSFTGTLTGRQIASLASFVVESTGEARDGSSRAGAAFTPDDVALPDCADDAACLEQAFGNLAFRRGPAAALAELARRSQDDSVEPQCHRIAHKIGAAALVRSRGDAGETLVAGTAICASGYYHGVAEQAFSGTRAAEIPAAARALCSSPSVRRTTFLAYQCIHGLGHGLMLWSSYDLPRALRICDGLRPEWDRVSCTGGVFMENLNSSYGIRSRWLRDDDPIYPCNAVAERHKLYCYLMVTSRILPLAGEDFAAAAETCRTSEPGWVATCFESYGRDAAGRSLGDAERILALCAHASSHARSCLYGAARDLVNTDGSPTRAARLCRLAQASLRGICFEGIGTIVDTLFVADEARAATCRRLSRNGRLVDACLAGAGVRR